MTLYHILKGSHENDQLWRKHFATEGHSVALVAEPERLDLSPYEIDKLHDVTDRTTAIGTWELSDQTHQFAEWAACWVKNSSRPIPLETLLKAVGFTEDEIKEIERDANSHRQLRMTLAE